MEDLRTISFLLSPLQPLHQHVFLSSSPDFTLVYFEKLVKGGEKKGWGGAGNWKTER